MTWQLPTSRMIVAHSLWSTKELMGNLPTHATCKQNILRRSDTPISVDYGCTLFQLLLYQTCVRSVRFQQLVVVPSVMAEENVRGDKGVGKYFSKIV